MVKDPEHVRKLFAREPGGPTFDLDAFKERSALRIPREHGSDERTWEVRQSHSTEESPEQGLWCATDCGGSGGKGTDRGESGLINQVPDTGPGRLATCVGTDTAGIRAARYYPR